jgi:hypothetical protein
MLALPEETARGVLEGIKTVLREEIIESSIDLKSFTTNLKSGRSLINLARAIVKDESNSGCDGH